MSFTKKSIADANVRGKVVLVRVDYNVPVDGGVVESDLRIRASLPTIELLRKKGAKKIILISHLGRPEGKRVAEMSLRPVYNVLAGLIPDVAFVEDVSGPDVEAAAEELPEGGVLLLENLRFFPGEEGNDPDFIREIIESVGATVFVQDGFAVVHRAHASTEAVTHELPSFAGLLVEKEVSTLSACISAPKHPVLVIIGGAKVDDKQPLIDAFSSVADEIAVVGKIAADGYTAPEGLAEKVYVAEDFREDSAGAKLDIGDAAVGRIVKMIEGASTVIWNGTAGMAEKPEFAVGSTALADAIASRFGKATTVICGGDTASFIEGYQATHPEAEFSLVSTGGGASLELLSGLPLPGVDSLDDK